MRNKIFALIFFLALIGNTQAQSTFLGQNPVIGGVRVSCLGLPTYVDPQIQDIAIAYNGNIILHPNLFNFPPAVQVFIYTHECAHMVPAIGSNENAADCWAVKLGRNQGWINSQSLNLIQSYFSNSSGDWTHLPGPYRVQQLNQCFYTP